jgi:plasmid maintenance system antidote protein VapI
MPEIIRPDAGKVLNQEIKNRGLKQGYVADKIGISPAYMSQLVNGSKKVSTDVAVRASIILGVPLDIFLKKS